MHKHRIVGAGLLLLAAAMPASARDMTDPVGTADSFSAALTAGDEATTLVLKRGLEGWRIVRLQWSSRPAEPKAE